MANTYVAPDFNIDTSTNVAGLTALKGGAPAATDVLWVAEAATVTIESSCSFLTTYRGDNSGGTAAVKTGTITVDAGQTLTLATTTLHAGLDGEGSTSVLTVNGKVTCSTVDKVTNFNNTNSKVILGAAGEFEHIYAIYSSHVDNQFLGTFTDCGPGVAFPTTTAKKPTSMNGCRFVGCTNSIYDTSSGAGLIQWDDFFMPWNNEITLTPTADGQCPFLLKGGSASGVLRYVAYLSSTTDIYIAPTWDTTTGIQTLTDNANLTINASWNTATVAGTTRYRLYIRDGAAPNAFGVTSAYFLAEIVDTSYRIACDAAGAVLDTTKTYHVIVRACDVYGNEDTNTTALTVTPTAASVAGVYKLCQVILAHVI